MKVIEVTGLPKAGKTTLVNRLAVRLRSQGLSVKKILDVSGKCPIDPDNVWLYQTWVAHRVIDKLTEAHNKKYDVVLVHRGLVERIITILTFYKYKLLISKQAKLITDYLKAFMPLEDLVIYLDILPKVSLRRNKGRKGKQINLKFLTIMRRCYHKQFPKIATKYFQIDAGQDINEVVKAAEDFVKTVIKK